MIYIYIYLFIWSGLRLTKRQATSRPEYLWPELWRGMSKNAKLREKHIWAIEKPKLDNARRLRGIYFIDPEDMEFKDFFFQKKKKQEENSKHQWLQLCLAILARKTSMGRPVARLMISSLILHVSWKPVFPQSCVWKNLYRITMSTILQEEGTIDYSISTLQFCTQIEPNASSHEDTAAKAAMVKEWDKLEKILAWDMTKVRSESEVTDEARTSGATVHFCITDGHLSFEECRIGDTAPKN